MCEQVQCGCRHVNVWRHIALPIFDSPQGHQHHGRIQWSTLIGASLSEPHIDEFAVEFLYIYRTSCRKSHPALILRVLASFVNSKTIHKLLVLNSARRHQPSSNSKNGNHSWTYLFNG